MHDVHYLKIDFGFNRENAPEIYDFLWIHMPTLLKKLSAKKVQIEIERLEPMDEIYTNLNLTEKGIKKIFDKFAKSHHLKQVPSIVFDNSKTSLRATVPLGKLGKIFDDYNTLFDIFFTDTIIRTDNNLTFDMMDGFSNSLLVIGKKKHLEKLVAIAKKLLDKSTKFEFVDHSVERRT